MVNLKETLSDEAFDGAQNIAPLTLAMVYVTLVISW